MEFTKKGIMESCTRLTNEEKLPRPHINIIKKKIDAGEKIIEAFDDRTFHRIYAALESEYDESMVEKLKRPEYKIIKTRAYPKEMSERLSVMMGDREWSPYPFSMGYAPFVRINPHFSKYDSRTINNITVEELKDSIPLIRPDWLAGIAEVFEHALVFYSSDAFEKDSYYNWFAKGQITDEFRAKFERYKTNGNLAQLHKEYELPQVFENCDDMMQCCMDRQRKKYIDNCQKILDAYRTK
jgi:hypothetical protein